VFGIFICRVIEAINFGLIVRWNGNIKADLMKFIRLVRQRNVFLSTDEATGKVDIKTKIGEVLGDAQDIQDFTKFLSAIKERQKFNPNQPETFVVENLWDILNSSDITDVDVQSNLNHGRMDKQYLNGANSLLD
jgi:hypothetical protein